MGFYNYLLAISSWTSNWGLCLKSVPLSSTNDITSNPLTHARRNLRAILDLISYIQSFTQSYWWYLLNSFLSHPPYLTACLLKRSSSPFSMLLAESFRKMRISSLPYDCFKFISLTRKTKVQSITFKVLWSGLCPSSQAFPILSCHSCFRHLWATDIVTNFPKYSWYLYIVEPCHW